ncbi:sulfur oxidation c-type cytochrome SoxX [Citreimonas salinaria]|uniref:Sulfur-oxidizing protein SoxX n=1 Tax=Citreimonas salinaria TaxID=321339 RepID=A0A1H3JLM0_9RHOB|nr:sulfur oxidation c-type cytochrome SoxX [Citreimonas salinaria]SDY40853.1 sulfur-oxidizing protein SoxX [Citreimonas salinaria]
MRLTAITMAVALSAGMAVADTVAPTQVTYGEYGAIETSLSGQVGDAERGRELMIARGKGNCIACHAVEALSDAPFHGEVGPPLDAVGSYRSPAELRGIVANAKMTFPETVMPAFYKTTGFIRPGDGYTGKAAEGELDPILTAQEIEDVVAFLMTLQGS